MELLINVFSCGIIDIHCIHQKYHYVSPQVSQCIRNAKNAGVPVPDWCYPVKKKSPPPVKHRRDY